MTKPNVTTDTREHKQPHADTRLVNFTDASFFDDENPYNVERLPKIQGITFEWHRVSFMGENDEKNVAKSIQDGCCSGSGGSGIADSGCCGIGGNCGLVFCCGIPFGSN